VAKAIPLRAALGVEGDLPTEVLSVIISGYWQQRSYYVIIDDPGGFVDNFLFEANSAEERGVDEIQGKATGAACFQSANMTM